MGDGPDGPAFDLNVFRRQIGQLGRVGSLRDLLARVPGLRAALGGLADLDVDLWAEVRRIQGIIDSMTADERATPALIDGTRRRRIARGAGVHPAEVVSLLRQYDAMAAMVSQIAAIAGADPLGLLAGLDRPPARRGAPELDRRSPLNLHRRVPPRESVPYRVEHRSLTVEQPLSPLERATMRRLWDILARNGRRPAGQGPWFAHWNRNLCLWDFQGD